MAAEPVEDQLACAWPGCLHAEVLLSLDGGVTNWCLTHCDDDFLPELLRGCVGFCVRCHTVCTSWLTRYPDQADIALHETCRRAWYYEMAAEGFSSIDVRRLAPRKRATGVYERKAGPRPNGESP